MFCFFYAVTNVCARYDWLLPMIYFKTNTRKTSVHNNEMNLIHELAPKTELHCTAKSGYRKQTHFLHATIAV